MFQTFLLIFLGILFLFFIIAAFIFYQRSKLEDETIKQLNTNGIKSFGEVIDKIRMKQAHSKFWKEYLIIQYGGNNQNQNLTTTGTFSTHQTKKIEPEKYYVHEYQVNSTEYRNTNIGQKIAIKYAPKNPEIVKVLNSDSTMSKMKFNLLYKVLVGLSLIPLYLFLELLITGESLLKMFIDF